MRFSVMGVILSLISGAALAQTGGTITGTVVDPAGAVVASAAIEARNTDTNAVYPVASSSTGNYTLPGLPPGTYELDISASGFKKFVRPSLVVQNAQTIRINAKLEVGATTESVTVTEAAPLLKTESGELSQTVAGATMDQLPVLQVGVDNSGIRNPYAGTFTLPGALALGPNNNSVGLTVVFNGNPHASETALVDGMNNTNIMNQGGQQENAPGQDSIEEFTVQTSNYSAEYGQAGGAVVNMVMKSGTNQFHGSLYDYLQNEDLNAGVPFTDSGNGHLTRPAVRRNDYGFTVGGPIWIPKVYDGHNRSFFFFGWEQFLQNNTYLPTPVTLPTAAYQAGDFSGAIAAAGNHSIGTDPTGATVFANEIFDPLTARPAANGQIVASQFPNNTIPLTRMDPVSLKMQALIPTPFCVAGGLCNVNSALNNFQNTQPIGRSTFIPSLKLDQLIGTRDKLSFYWSRTGTYCKQCYGEDGVPQPISGSFGAGIYSHVERLNYDHTVTPTVLLHLGVGFNFVDLGRPSVTPVYDSCGELDLCSQAFTSPTSFPRITGLYNSLGGGFGISTAGQFGPPPRSDNLSSTFNNVASLTWVKGNHTFKFGGSLDLIGNYQTGVAQKNFAFSDAETAEPYQVSLRSGASSSNGTGAYTPGFPYASFLLGSVDNANINPTYDARFGQYRLGLYAQDSWKITPKFTLDYGLRYDYSTYYTEQYGRSPNFAPNVDNPTAGGHPGATIYEATCNCQFAQNYPWGFGPRLGFAYQVLPKTVLRGGFGIVYSGVGVGQHEDGAGKASASNPFGPSVPGEGIMTWGQGVTINGSPLTAAQIAWPNLSPGYYPIGGVIPGTGPQYTDQNAGRPARQYQYSFSIQREITNNLVVDASYVGNRGIWWPTYDDAGLQMTNYNYLSTSVLNHYGLSLSNPADLQTLLARIGSAAAGPFQNQIPFAGFPLTASVAQALRPFPQFNGGINPVGAPLGGTWYNSLQATATKRLSRGLQATFNFTWSKTLNSFCGTPDPQNYSLAKCVGKYDQPLVTRLTVDYSLPAWGPKIVSHIVRDWTLDAFGAWASGLPLVAPTANTAGYPAGFSGASMANLVFVPSNSQYQIPTGQPFYLQDINCHCFDPQKTIVLNPAAWANPAPGNYGGAEFLPAFRQQRRPIENFGIGRIFRIKERYSLSVRAEFTNIFNRTTLVDPSTANPQTAPHCYGPTGTVGACSAGETIASGFGWINTASATGANLPRQGQLVARFTF
jgi:Carboxypeptidase regulatory-like domain/TonB dependent receptor-like, beta-barrel